MKPTRLRSALFARGSHSRGLEEGIDMNAGIRQWGRRIGVLIIGLPLRSASRR